MPKVSVLMPAYNAEKYIVEAIESILSQTFQDFEFIIINDGSTDNTVKIIQEYAKRDKRIRFINNSRNQGLIAVLNQGLDLCRGEYIARMDCDDISLPERFAKQVKYLDEHPNVVVVGTWMQIFGKNNSVCECVPNVTTIDLIIKGNLVAHSVAMLRKSVLRDNNIYYNPKYIYIEDYALWFQLLNYGEIHNIQETLLKYRIHDESVSVLNRDAQHESARLIHSEILHSMFDNQNNTKAYNSCFWLFGFIPLLHITHKSRDNTKFWLFKCVPLLKIKRGRVYLFHFLGIGIIKKKN